MALGKQIKRYREKLGWTLEDLFALSGVEVGTISALENRDSSRSKFGPPIAKAFGLTMEQLLDESTLHEGGNAPSSLAVGKLPLDQVLRELAAAVAKIDPASRDELAPMLSALVMGPDSQEIIDKITTYIETAPLKKRGTPELGAHQPQQQQQQQQRAA